MAVSFSTTFSSDTVYSYELQTLSLSSTATRLQLSIYRAIEGSTLRDLVFQTNYATTAIKNEYGEADLTVAAISDTTTQDTVVSVEREVMVYDLGTVIEQWVEAHGGSIDEYYFLVQDAEDDTDVAELTLWVVYCPQRFSSANALSAEDLRLTRFLHTRPVRLTYLSAAEPLCYWYPNRRVIGGLNVFVLRITAHCCLADGSLQNIEHSERLSTGTGVRQLDASPAQILSLLTDVLPADSTLVGYTLNMGSRSCRFYIAPECAYRTFYFLNAYHCTECVHIPTTRTRQLKTKSSSAQCGDTLSQYDVQHTRTYQEQTAVLTLADALHLEELLTSPSVWLLINGTTCPILITDYTFEVSDTPAAENRLQFEWQFADLRQSIPLTEPTRIFTNPYQEPFL